MHMSQVTPSTAKRRRNTSIDNRYLQYFAQYYAIIMRSDAVMCKKKELQTLHVPVDLPIMFLRFFSNQ